MNNINEYNKRVRLDESSLPTSKKQKKDCWMLAKPEFFSRQCLKFSLRFFAMLLECAQNKDSHVKEYQAVLENINRHRAIKTLFETHIVKSTSCKDQVSAEPSLQKLDLTHPKEFVNFTKSYNFSIQTIIDSIDNARPSEMNMLSFNIQKLASPELQFAIARHSIKERLSWSHIKERLSWPHNFIGNINHLKLLADIIRHNYNSKVELTKKLVEIGLYDNLLELIENINDEGIFFEYNEIVFQIMRSLYYLSLEEKLIKKDNDNRLVKIFLFQLNSSDTATKTNCCIALTHLISKGQTKAIIQEKGLYTVRKLLNDKRDFILQHAFTILGRLSIHSEKVYQETKEDLEKVLQVFKVLPDQDGFKESAKFAALRLLNIFLQQNANEFGNKLLELDICSILFDPKNSPLALSKPFTLEWCYFTHMLLQSRETSNLAIDNYLKNNIFEIWLKLLSHTEEKIRDVTIKTFLLFLHTDVENRIKNSQLGKTLVNKFITTAMEQTSSEPIEEYILIPLIACPELIDKPLVCSILFKHLTENSNLNVLPSLKLLSKHEDGKMAIALHPTLLLLLQEYNTTTFNEICVDISSSETIMNILKTYPFTHQLHAPVKALLTEKFDSIADIFAILQDSITRPLFPIHSLLKILSPLTYKPGAPLTYPLILHQTHSLINPITFTPTYLLNEGQITVCYKEQLEKCSPILKNLIQTANNPHAIYLQNHEYQEITSLLSAIRRESQSFYSLKDLLSFVLLVEKYQIYDLKIQSLELLSRVQISLDSKNIEENVECIKTFLAQFPFFTAQGEVIEENIFPILVWIITNADWWKEGREELLIPHLKIFSQKTAHFFSNFECSSVEQKKFSETVKILQEELSLFDRKKALDSLKKLAQDDQGLIRIAFHPTLLAILSQMKDPEAINIINKVKENFGIKTILESYPFVNDDHRVSSAVLTKSEKSINFILTILQNYNKEKHLPLKIYLDIINTVKHLGTEELPLAFSLEAPKEENTQKNHTLILETNKGPIEVLCNKELLVKHSPFFCNLEKQKLFEEKRSIHTNTMFDNTILLEFLHLLEGKPFIIDSFKKLANFIAAADFYEFNLLKIEALKILPVINLSSLHEENLDETALFLLRILPMYGENKQAILDWIVGNGEWWANHEVAIQNHLPSFKEYSL